MLYTYANTYVHIMMIIFSPCAMTLSKHYNNYTDQKESIQHIHYWTKVFLLHNAYGYGTDAGFSNISNICTTYLYANSEFSVF